MLFRRVSYALFYESNEWDTICDTGGIHVPLTVRCCRCGVSNGDANRCDSPGNHSGKPKPTPEDKGGCLHGCLFNVTADVEEKHNLFHDAQYAGTYITVLQNDP